MEYLKIRSLSPILINTPAVLNLGGGDVCHGCHSIQIEELKQIYPLVSKHCDQRISSLNSIAKLNSERIRKGKNFSIKLERDNPFIEEVHSDKVELFFHNSIYSLMKVLLSKCKELIVKKSSIFFIAITLLNAGNYTGNLILSNDDRLQFDGLMVFFNLKYSFENFITTITLTFFGSFIASYAYSTLKLMKDPSFKISLGGSGLPKGVFYFTVLLSIHEFSQILIYYGNLFWSKHISKTDNISKKVAFIPRYF